DGAVPLREVAGEVVRLVEQLGGLLQVDDVDAAALREDEAAHLGVPAARLVAEMHPGLEQVAHGDNGHGSFFRLLAGAADGARTAPARRPAPAARAGPPGRRDGYWPRSVAAAALCRRLPP